MARARRSPADAQPGPDKIVTAKAPINRQRTGPLHEARVHVGALQRVVEHDVLHGEPLDGIADHLIVTLARIEMFLELAAVAA